MATREFKFSKNELELVIEGNVFRINPYDEDIVELQREFSQRAQKMAEKTESGDEDGAECIRLCSGFIDDVLGGGAVRLIFKNRKIGVYDLFDVVNYINDEIRTEREKRLTIYNKNPKYNTYKKERRRYAK